MRDRKLNHVPFPFPVEAWVQDGVSTATEDGTYHQSYEGSGIYWHQDTPVGDASGTLTEKGTRDETYTFASGGAMDNAGKWFYAGNGTDTLTRKDELNFSGGGAIHTFTSNSGGGWSNSSVDDETYTETGKRKSFDSDTVSWTQAIGGNWVQSGEIHNLGHSSHGTLTYQSDRAWQQDSSSSYAYDDMSGSAASHNASVHSALTTQEFDSSFNYYTKSDTNPDGTTTTTGNQTRDGWAIGGRRYSQSNENSHDNTDTYGDYTSTYHDQDQQSETTTENYSWTLNQYATLPYAAASDVFSSVRIGSKTIDRSNSWSWYDDYSSDGDAASSTETRSANYAFDPNYESVPDCGPDFIDGGTSSYQLGFARVVKDSPLVGGYWIGGSWVKASSQPAVPGAGGPGDEFDPSVTGDTGGTGGGTTGGTNTSPPAGGTQAAAAPIWASPTPKVVLDDARGHYDSIQAAPPPTWSDYVLGPISIINNGTAKAVDGIIDLFTGVAFNLTHTQYNRPGLFEDQNPWRLNSMHKAGEKLGSTDLSRAYSAYGVKATDYGVQGATLVNGFIITAAAGELVGLARGSETMAVKATAAEGATTASTIKDITIGRSVPNISTNATAASAEQAILANGYTLNKIVQGNNGLVKVFEKGGNTYTLYPGTSTGGPTLSLKNALNQLILKVRLQ